MIVLVTIKGNRKNTHKRYTKSEKIMLSDYFIFCNHFLSVRYQKKGMLTVWTLPKEQSLSVSFLFRPFLMMCADWEKSAKPFDSSLEPGGQSAWSLVQDFTSPKSHLCLMLDIQFLALNRNTFKISGYTCGWRQLDLKPLSGCC